MEQQKSNHGGKRPGAGRPKGALQKAPKIKHETSFYVACSHEQRAKLKAYWQTIRQEQ